MRWRLTRWRTISQRRGVAIATFSDWWGYKQEALGRDSVERSHLDAQMRAG